MTMNLYFNRTLRIVCLIATAFAVLLLVSCSSSAPLEDAVLDEYEASIDAMVAALEGGDLQKAQAAMQTYIPIANKLGVSLTGASEAQLERLFAISEKGTSAAVRVQAAELIGKFEMIVADMEAASGDTESLSAAASKAAEIADSLSLLEYGMSPEQYERYTPIYDRYNGLLAGLSVGTMLVDLEEAISGLDNARAAGSQGLVDEFTGRIRRLAGELRAIPELDFSQESKLNQLLSNPTAASVLEN